MQLKKKNVLKTITLLLSVFDHPDVKSLMNEMNRLKEEKDDLARFGSYCDSSHIQERMTDIRRELYRMPEMNAYLESYSELNKMLDEITDIVFDDISDELAKGRIGRSYARYSR